MEQCHSTARSPGSIWTSTTATSPRCGTGPSTAAAASRTCITPRVYLEDDDASAPTDPDVEAGAVSAWLADNVAGDPVALRHIVRPFLADDSEPDWEEDAAADADDADIYVEVKTAKFLKAVGLAEPVGYWD